MVKVWGMAKVRDLAKGWDPATSHERRGATANEAARHSASGGISASGISTSGISEPEIVPSGRHLFSKFAQIAAHATGTPTAFLLAAGTIVVWAVTGPMFGYSDTWQLVINTGTTIVTFLMVFLIQNTQNRDMLAMQLKLAELIIAMKGADNALATIEDLAEEELEGMHKHYCERATLLGSALENRRGARTS